MKIKKLLGILLLAGASLFAQEGTPNPPQISGNPPNAAGWTDDGSNITATSGRNVVIGTTLPENCPAGQCLGASIIYSPNGALNVKAWGATGDGVTDDTAAIQAAQDYLEANGGGALFFPEGQYLHTALTIDASVGVHWIGLGWSPLGVAGSSLIKASGATASLTIGAADESRTADVLIENLGFYGSSVASSTGIAIIRTHHVKLDRVKVEYYGIGITLDRAFSTKVYNSYINNQLVDGLKVTDDLNDQTIIDNTSFLANAGKGVWFAAGSSCGSTVTNSVFQGNGVGFQLDCGSVANPTSFRLEGNYFEDQTGKNASFCEDAGTATAVNLIFAYNHINIGATSAAANAIAIDDVQGVIIVGNTINSANVTFTANTLLPIIYGNRGSGSAWPDVPYLTLDNDQSFTGSSQSAPKIIGANDAANNGLRIEAGQAASAVTGWIAVRGNWNGSANVGGDTDFGTNELLRAQIPWDGGFRLKTQAATACDAAHEGTFFYTTGTPSTIQICVKETGGTYGLHTVKFTVDP